MLFRSLTILTFVAALSCAAAFARDTKTKDTKPATATATPKPLPFEPDEQLVYAGEFSRALLRGINIAEFKFTVERRDVTTPTMTQGVRGQVVTPNLVFKADALAKGWFRKLFGLDFHYNSESVVEPQSFLILRTTTHDEQGKRVRDSEAVFDRVHNQLTWTLRNPNDPESEPRVVTASVGDASHDLISAIYFLRTQPLEPGRTFDLMVSDSGAVYHVPVRVGERKRMKSVVGRVETVRVDVDIFGAERLIARKGEMTLWLTDDARRLPVRARVNTDLGTLDITLKKVSGGNAATRR
ncbi:MAG TPA: DUF3108 domain-containing protein [Pyrinomonadaceae bacterium]|nr:DUF3108 domain-containing protein [Pyrinomonadaceae bacterium]